jgi:hypothetical protein
MRRRRRRMRMMIMNEALDAYLQPFAKQGDVVDA